MKCDDGGVVTDRIGCKGSGDDFGGEGDGGRAIRVGNAVDWM